MNKDEMRKYLTGKGFTFTHKTAKLRTTLTTINWEGIKAGYLLNDDVRLFDDTDPRRARLISVQYTNPRCLERVDRIILYLKTSDNRRERRMRRERAKQVRAYFENQNNKLREIDRQIAILEAEYYRRQEQFMLAEMC